MREVDRRKLRLWDRSSGSTLSAYTSTLRHHLEQSTDSALRVSSPSSATVFDQCSPLIEAQEQSVPDLHVAAHRI